MSQSDCRGYFDPTSKDDKTQKLTFLIELLHEDQKEFLRHVFPGDKKCIEIDQYTANEILVKSSPNHNYLHRLDFNQKLKGSQELKEAFKVEVPFDSMDSGRRPHLTKDERLPASYKEVEKVLKKVMACKANVKTVLNNSRLRGSVFRKVYSLSVNVLQHRFLLEKIIEDIQLLKHEKFMRKELAEILIYELIFGKGIPGESKPVITILKYEKEIREAYENATKDGSLSVAGLRALPRYVRVNTLLTTVSDVLRNLTSNDFQQIFYEENISEDRYMELVKNLESGSFLIDYHFKDLFVFANNENLTTWSLYQKGLVFIQDKSSYIPVHVLNPQPNATVLDACAAPGMKTIHIAASMENKGKIFAYERDKERFETLKDRLEISGTEICKADCEDFYLVNPNDPKFRSLEYILVDPSCSGSGMVSRMDYVTDTEDSKNSFRLQKLAGFQILLLKHALSFPSVKHVVYSTCSVHEEENEYVVHEVLNHFNRIFKLVRVLPNWSVRGSDKFEYGNLCLRASPEKNLSNGFFVAMFERLGFEEQQSLHLDNSSFAGSSRKRQRERKKDFPQIQTVKEEYNGSESGIVDVKEEIIDHVDVKEEVQMEGNEENSSAHNKSKRKKHKKKHSENIETIINHVEVKEAVSNHVDVKEEVQIEGNEEDSSVGTKHKRKKHKKKHSNDMEDTSKEHVNSLLDSCSKNNGISCPSETEISATSNVDKKKKKKHKKRNSVKVESVDENPDLCVTDTKSNCEPEDTTIVSDSNKVKKKKHKRRHSNIEDSTNEQINSLSTETTCHSVTDIPVLSNSTKEKKKKHKKSHYVIEDSAKEQLISVSDTQPMDTETTCHSVTDISTLSNDNKEKKHRKRKSNVVDMSEENIDLDIVDTKPANLQESDSMSSKSKKKKHKKKHLDEVEEL